MTKLPIRKKVRYKKRRMLVTKYLRDQEDYDNVWSAWNFVLADGNEGPNEQQQPIELHARDLLQRFSDNDCLRFLRFTRAQVS